MPLDQFKTQVLLLHSEQSALDSLSSGFGDSYTVHCATSGSEALTTLGETPINVIISAQKLPGMSGVEALREAKKRSPETIGILLASNEDRDVQALVGEKEVFQVVQGDVTGDGLKKLVDGATRQMRLMALAESANDMAAAPDEPAEHIIMETSENGSTIISDATGRMPALNPEKFSAAAAVGSQSVDVLVLTKDQEFLTTIKESSRGMHTVHYANTLKQADELIRKHKVGVAVVDAAMVGQKVEQLTLHLRKGSPRLVSIVAGRRDDGEMLMDLINRGKVYRFLLKPVSPGRARLAVEASVKHHLEAPDAAFKVKGGAAAPQPTAKAKAKPEAKAKPAPKPAPKAEAKPQPKPKAQPRVEPQPQKKATKPARPAPVDPPLGNPGTDTLIDDGLSAAFGGDDNSFTETVTGLVSGLGKKIKSDKKSKPEPDVKSSDTLAGLETPAAVTSGDGTSSSFSPKIIGGVVAAVVVVAGALWFFMSGTDNSAPIAEPTASTTNPSITEPDADFTATDEPAIDIDAAVASAETALLEARLDDAEAALQQIAVADPQNPRLTFLSAQLAQMRLREFLTDARAAIRDTRFEDAANSLSSARALAVNDTTEIDAVAEELQAARSEQQADEVLALASARLEEGNLLSPSNDNARYYYNLVLSNDPSNTAALQGLNVIASRLVLQARTEIDAGRLSAAQALLADARAIDASSTELTSTEAALQAARDAIVARERRAAEARRQAEAERAAAAQREEAERQAVEAQEPVDPAEDTAVAEQQAESVEQPNQAAVTEPPPEPIDVLDQKPVTASSLTRTRYVAPKYPRAAQRRRESGWVDIVFTVSLDGSVRDVEVRESQPEGTFDSAAVRAVEKWMFEPVVENNETVEKRAAVRMMFALE